MSVKVVNNFSNAEHYDNAKYYRYNKNLVQYRTQHLFIDGQGRSRAVIVEYTRPESKVEDISNEVTVDYIQPKSMIVEKPDDCEIPQEVMESAQKYMALSLSEIKATIKKYGKIRD